MLPLRVGSRADGFDPHGGAAATSYMRHAPVLMKPLVGRKAIEATARAYAQQQALRRAQQENWKTHVFHQNLAQQVRRPDRAAQ